MFFPSTHMSKIFYSEAPNDWKKIKKNSVMIKSYIMIFIHDQICLWIINFVVSGERDILQKQSPEMENMKLILRNLREHFPKYITT